MNGLPSVNYHAIVGGSSRLAFSFACIGLAGQYLGFITLSSGWVSVLSYYVLANGFFGVPALGIVHHFFKGVSAEASCPNCKNAMISSGFVCPECGTQANVPSENNKVGIDK